jgi:glycosyltransferase involved in cell wall biosynthesis
VPFYRDVITLLFTRWCAKKIVFQFHAGNFSGLLEKLNVVEKSLAQLAYKKPDAAIVLLPSLKSEVLWIRPRKVFVVPNGIEDQYHKYQKISTNNSPNILFVGSMNEKKGVLICLEAVNILKERNIDFVFNLVGEWSSLIDRDKAEEYINKNDLTRNIIFWGSKHGPDKWALFSNADIFCLPTHDTEAMPVTIIEAMMMSLPVISTQWRSIPDIVSDGKDGFLVSAVDSHALAEKILLLVNNANLRKTMGYRGREKYLKNYTLENHLIKMEEVFRNVAQP